MQRLFVITFVSHVLSVLSTNLDGPGPFHECVSEWPALCKFVDPLPIPPEISLRAHREVVQLGAYTIKSKLHRDLPATTMYGYGLSADLASSPGPTLVATRGSPSRVHWLNNITDSHGYLIPVDPTLVWANPEHGGVPMVPHLHGGETQSIFDGHPEAWWTHKGEKGPTYVTQAYEYPNKQEAATLWYHDHVLGVSRLSVYLGLAGAYLIRDPVKEATLKLPQHKNDIPLIVQDKLLREDGSLDYPQMGINPSVHPSWVPKLFGNVMTVNGKCWPFHVVERAEYRLRWINGCNSRYLNITFISAPLSPSTSPSLHIPPGAVLRFHQISSDGGYLNAAIEMKWILLGPGERADIVIDFRECGKSDSVVYGRQNAHVPNHKVDPETDDNSALLLFHIQGMDKGQQGIADSGVAIKLLKAEGSNWKRSKLNQITQADERMATVTRWLTMREYSVAGLPAHSLLTGSRWRDPVTERPVEGKAEVWNIINLTTGPHPMHIHLTPHRLLHREPLNLTMALTGACSFPFMNSTLPPCLRGVQHRPSSNEEGWKDTSNCDAGAVTSVLIKFSSQDGTPFPFNPSVGPGYLWHCHSLEHEDNEMMRPFVVQQDN